jgi:hypothetical protein
VEEVGKDSGGEKAGIKSGLPMQSVERLSEIGVFSHDTVESQITRTEVQPGTGN